MTTNENSTFVTGNCETLCPRFYYEERLKTQEISIFEDVHPITKYRRPSSSKGVLSPELIRPLPVLEQTLGFLMSKTLTRKDSPFYKIYNFLSDRLRAIRLDIRYQNLSSKKVIRIYEIIVRFRILSSYLLCEIDDLDLYDPYQNIEQLEKCLITLHNHYLQNRTKNNLIKMK